MMHSLPKLGLALGLMAATAGATPAAAHPHVFVDGGVDFVMQGGTVLEALEITWLYDPFETLYILATQDITPDADWSLQDKDRARLIARESDWSDEFKGSAHLSLAGNSVELSPPSSFDVKLKGERLQVTFRRDLLKPIDLTDRPLDVAFYEATYFYAFSVASPPQIIGDAGHCAPRVIPFDPDVQLAKLQTTLFALGREETPAIENVGALFADRIVLECA